jgi:tetratricopeptide (TPR) repeat protein
MRRSFGVLSFLSLALLASALMGLASGCGRASIALEHRVHALVSRNMNAEAGQLVRSALVKRPEDPQLLALLGYVHLSSGEFRSADSAYALACSRDTVLFDRYADDLIARGGLLLDQSEWDLAWQVFDRARTVSPERREEIGQAYATKGGSLIEERTEDADRLMETAVQFDSSVRGEVANAYFQAGKRGLLSDIESALGHMDRAITWQPAFEESVGLVLGATAPLVADRPRDLITSFIERLGGETRSRFNVGAGNGRSTLRVEVLPAAGWTRARVEVRQGDTLQFFPSGTVRAEAGREGWISEPCGPGGWSQKYMEWLEEGVAALPDPRAARMSLVARIGGGAPFLVATSGIRVADASGPVYLAVNEFSEHAGKASGGFTVRLQVPVSALRSGQNDGVAHR